MNLKLIFTTHFRLFYELLWSILNYSNLKLFEIHHQSPFSNQIRQSNYNFIQFMET